MSEAVNLNDDIGLNDDVLVLDDASAEMVLRQLKAAEDQYDRMKSWYDHQIQNLKDIRDRTRIWAETVLRPYMDMVPATGKKIRSYEMPGGVMKLAKQDPEFEVDDEKLVPWLEANKMGDFVQVKKEAKWGEFKKTLPKNKSGEIQMIVNGDGTADLLSADGEVIPGITAKIREDKFSIKCK